MNTLQSSITHHRRVSSKHWYSAVGPVFSPVFKLVGTNLRIVCLQASGRLSSHNPPAESEQHTNEELIFNDEHYY